MYKRPPSKNAFQYKEPKAKMRKLNVLSGAGASNQPESPKPNSALQMSRPSTSKVATNDKPSATSSSAHAIRKPDVAPQPSTTNVPPLKDDNLWGDSDDECILIASQMIDNMDMDAINQQIIVQSMNMSQGMNGETKEKTEAQNMFKDFLQSTEEDDRIFSEINNFDNIGNHDTNDFFSSTVIPKAPEHHQASQRPTSPTIFKIPSHIPHEKRANPTVTFQSSTQIEMNISFRPELHPQSTQFTQNIEVPRPTGNLKLPDL